MKKKFAFENFRLYNKRLFTHVELAFAFMRWKSAHYKEIHLSINNDIFIANELYLRYVANA